MTTVTCHECGMLTDLHVMEWPPQMFVCSRCDSVFALTYVTQQGEPIFDIVGYCRYRND